MCKCWQCNYFERRQRKFTGPKLVIMPQTLNEFVRVVKVVLLSFSRSAAHIFKGVSIKHMSYIYLFVDVILYAVNNTFCIKYLLQTDVRGAAFYINIKTGETKCISRAIGIYCFIKFNIF